MEVSMEKHIHNINDEKIKEVELLDNETIYDMSTLFKMFSDPTRIKIMYVLSEKSLNVCEISHLLNMTHSAISHKLATLKMANLVKGVKVGKEVYYSLIDNHIASLLSIGKERVLEG
jgi:ArsR family transcriptional regulator